MVRLLKKLIDSEGGQALPIVLGLLVLSGLMIASTLSYAGTNLNSIRTIEKSVNGLYAAEAGVKYALCNLGEGPHQLTDINHMEVAVQVETSNVTHVLYFGELIQGEQHSNYLGVDSEIVWDEEATPPAYKYTITIVWQAGPGVPVIHLEEVGGRLPAGYSYKPESAANFANNLSRDEPEVIETGGADMLNWEFASPLPSVSENNTVQTQNFYIIGEGDLEDYYAWVLASRDDIGETSEISGILYRITATAICPQDGETTGKIVCAVLKTQEGSGDSISIISWQASR